MPYKSEHIKLPRNLDRRVKLSEEDIEHIRWLHKEGVAIRAIAREYEKKCSRRRIQQLVNPELAARMKQRFKEHWKDYFDRKKLTDAVRSLRRYKHDLYKKGIIQ